jgi:diguanylate cyclase (GGDEF)-like protein
MGRKLADLIRFNIFGNFAALLAAFLAVSWLAPFVYTVFATDSFLIMHTLLELIAVVVSLSICTIVWLMWEGFDDYCGKFVMVFGLSFFASGAVDIMHILGYSGMPAFITVNSQEKSIFFWLFGRYLVAAGFLAAFLWPKENGFRLSLAIKVIGSLASVAIVAALFLGTEFIDLVPALYSAAAGLTPLKVGLEYALIGLYLLAMLLLTAIRAKLTASVLRNLLYFFVLSIFSELTFTVYDSVFDTYNLIGHLYKACAYYCLFKAVYLAGVVNHFYTLGEMGKMSAELLKEEISLEAVLEIQMPKLKKLIPQAEQICVFLTTGGCCYRTVYSWGKFSELFPVGGEFCVSHTLDNSIQHFTDPASLLEQISEKECTPALSVILKASRQILRIPLTTKSATQGVIVLYTFSAAARFTPVVIEKAKVFQQFATLAIAQAASQETILKLSYEDSLTGLPNRRWFFEELGRVRYDADQYGSPFTVVYLDMNGLKYINDHLGHEAGDAALQTIGRTLKAVARGSDVPARLGGDEFALLLRHVGLAEAAGKVAELKDVFGCLPLPEYDHVFSLAVGGASYPEETCSLEQLLSLADDRMYEHKRLIKSGQAG